MNKVIIEVTNWLVYIVFIAAVLLMLQLHGVLGGIAAFLVGCVTVATWAVLSGIYENTRKMARAAEYLARQSDKVIK